VEYANSRHYKTDILSLILFVFFSLNIYIYNDGAFPVLQLPQDLSNIIPLIFTKQELTDRFFTTFLKLIFFYLKIV
jgi:hypothetical protein